ncbi:MAG TPA: hypothetical protein VFV75_03205 [Candidatus Polarisedimenticolaceae bacterium]|nr:hypothetical protein [Candidatus Polarisedimenticolaceae bacterium]
MNRLRVAFLTVLPLLLAGCNNDGTTSAQFAASATPPAPGLVKLAQSSVSGTQVQLNVLLNGPEPDLDLNAFRFAVKISDPSAVRFVPQSSYAQSALIAGEGQSIVIDVDGASDPSRVNVQMRKAGGGPGNGFTSPAAVVISLTFEVLGSGGAALSFAGVGAFPAEALDSRGTPIDAVHFDGAGASLAAVQTGGGGY